MRRHAAQPRTFTANAVEGERATAMSSPVPRKPAGSIGTFLPGPLPELVRVPDTSLEQLLLNA
jgi:hypothetical protein